MGGRGTGAHGSPHRTTNGRPPRNTQHMDPRRPSGSRPSALHCATSPLCMCALFASGHFPPTPGTAWPAHLSAGSPCQQRSASWRKAGGVQGGNTGRMPSRATCSHEERVGRKPAHRKRVAVGRERNSTCAVPAACRPGPHARVPRCFAGGLGRRQLWWTGDNHGVGPACSMTHPCRQQHTWHAVPRALSCEQLVQQDGERVGVDRL